MRPTASIVLPVWGRWNVTRACLESLRPTLGLRDQVVVVDNGSTDGTAAGLRAMSWVTVVAGSADATPASARNAGIAAAANDVVVLLDADTLLTSRWLDALLAPLADATVAATGPRTNNALGPQWLPEVGYATAKVGDIQRYARERREDRRAATFDVSSLQGFCLAVRRADLAALGGLDEQFGAGGHDDSDLCLRLAADGRRLVVADDAFVHHLGTCAKAPEGVDWYARRLEARARLADKHPAGVDGVPADLLLSAAVIVKDEEVNLPGCLAALEGLVDEVVVYDTGSSDRTVQIAREAGATVVEGFWDDDFSRARNAVLAHCRGFWVLSVDADETPECEPAQVRGGLSTSTANDAFHTMIDNYDDHGEVEFSHGASRLFQRLRVHWRGRLHEQVTPRPGVTLRGGAQTEHLRLRHTGYTKAAMTERGKVDRNLRVARNDVDDAGGRDARTLVNLGRTLRSAGRSAEAVVEFAKVRDGNGGAHWVRQALRNGAEALLEVGRPLEALEWTTALRARTTSTTIPDYLEGLARLALQDTDGALACFERIDGLSDELSDEDSTVPFHILQTRRGLALASARRWDEAAAELLRAVQATRKPGPVWTPLVDATWRSGAPMADVAEAIDDERLMTALGQALNSAPDAADALAEALWDRTPGDARLLAFAVRMSVRLTLERMLEWAARLRMAGLEECPLITFAGDLTADPVERLRAAALAYEAFGDDRSQPALRGAAEQVADERFLEALAAVDELSPRLLTSVISGATGTRDRCRAMADVLRSIGADEQAEQLMLRATA